MRKWHIAGIQYMLVTVPLRLDMPGPEGETRDLENWGSGVQSDATPNLQCDPSLSLAFSGTQITYEDHEVGN